MTLPKTMTALRQLHSGYSDTPADQTLSDLSPFVELAEVPLPNVGAGQALIKVTRAAVNPSDVAFIKGVYGQPRAKGIAAGFEGTGTVVAGDTPLLGQRVSFFGSGSGTWAEYALTDIATLIPLRPDLKDEDAAGLIVNPVTAMAMFDIVRADGAKSFVATAGGSQLGKYLIGLGKDHGIGCVPVVRRAEQAEPLVDLGAQEVLVSSAPEFAKRMPEAMNQYGPRILLDAVGDQISSDIFFAMPDRARWVVYGRLSLTPPSLGFMGQFIVMAKQIEGFWLTRWLRDTPREEAAKVIGEVQARFAEGRWQTDISDVVPLSDAMTALPAAYGKKDAKVQLAPGG